jgi:hypothetical protein
LALAVTPIQVAGRRAVMEVIQYFLPLLLLGVVVVEHIQIHYKMGETAALVEVVGVISQ